MDTEPDSTQVADQRRQPRRSTGATIRMKIEADTLEGVGDNVSGVGLMFFAERPLRVVVEIEEDGKTTRFGGRLVRAQRMNETSTGYAIEFDPR